MTTAKEISYTKISLASNMPLTAVEAFDEAFGYRTEAQCLAMRVAIINGNDALVASIVKELYSAAILRNEELIDAERENEMARADAEYDAWKDSLPAPVVA